MKKLLSIILSAIMIFGLVSSVSAADKTANKAEIAIDLYSATVTVTTDVKDRIILKIMELKKDADDKLYVAPDSAIIYIGQIDANDCTEKDGIYTYTKKIAVYSQSLDLRLITNKGNYDFYYENPLDIIKLYQGIYNAADEAAVGKAIQDAVKSGYVSFAGNYTTKRYDAVRDLINAEIFTEVKPKLAVPPAVLNNRNTIATYIKNNESILMNELGRCLTAAEILTAEDAKAFEAAQSNEVLNKSLGLDTKWFEDKLSGIDSATVLSLIKNEVTNLKKLKNADVQKIYDAAYTLAAVQSISDYTKITSVLDYYDGKTINLDKSTYASSFDATQFDLVSQQVQENKAGATSLKALEDIYLAATKTVSEMNTTQDGALGGGGGGGGGGVASNPGPAPAGPSGTIGGNVTVNPEDLSDLDEAEWAIEAIEYLIEKGVLQGKGDGKFYPNDQVTREEFIKIIIEAFKLLDENASAEFDDVSEDRWSYKYIAAGYIAGIINGTSDTEFSPSGVISRQDMAVIIYRVAQYLGLQLPEEGADFDDLDEAAPYAKEAIAILAEAGIINGTGDNNFSPTGVVTRAQAAKIVYELLIAMGGTK